MEYSPPILPYVLVPSIVFAVFTVSIYFYFFWHVVPEPAKEERALELFLAFINSITNKNEKDIRKLATSINMVYLM
jgi:hypothetical protein